MDSREMRSFAKLTTLEAKQELKAAQLTSSFLSCNQVSRSLLSGLPCFLHLPTLLSRGDVFWCQAGHWGRPTWGGQVM